MAVSDPVECVEKMLHEGMYKGNRHLCILSAGRLTGGFYAGGSINVIDKDRLTGLAETLSQSSGYPEGVREWSQAVEFGMKDPVKWEQHRSKEERALGWGETVTFGGKESPPSDKPEYKVVDPNWVEDREVPEPGEDWDPVQNLIRYINTLFDAEEHIGYVTDSWYNEKSGVYLPKKGNCDRTAGQITQALSQCRGDLGAVIGDINEEVGAWIRFNPVDGNGVKDANVTSFRYALVESDDMPLPKQYALLKELDLPIAAMVYSGGKSIHAIVRIEADTMEEYRKRVDFLYEVCGRNGLKLDRQNRNPSRLSRMPGVIRKGKKQWLMCTNIGKPTWKEWEEWVVDLNDDLPDIEELDISFEEPELAPVLIDGVLREGHKLLLAGPSKAHKSFMLIQLAIAISEGILWMGWKTSQGRVLYVNLELDARSCRNRFWQTCMELGATNFSKNIDVWNLRGCATGLDKLTPKLIRRSYKKGYKAIIIDPVYKVLTGDENSAEQMAKFCNEFDKICTKLETATIFCHHHSKGAQGQKQSMDRSSGSGVFGRDPDAIIDLIELEIDDKLRQKTINYMECVAMQQHLDVALGDSWKHMIPADKLHDAGELLSWGSRQAGVDRLGEVRLIAHKEAQLTTGWRIEPTMREFAPMSPKTLFFRYPIHILDTQGILSNAKADGEEPSWMKRRMDPEEKKQRYTERQEEKKLDRLSELEVAIKAGDNGDPSVKEVSERLACTVKTVRNRVAEHPKYKISKNLVVPIKVDAGIPATERVV